MSVKLDLRPLFRSEIGRMPVEAELCFSDLDFYGLHPIQQPVRVEGAVVCSAGVVRLCVDVTLVYEAPCDRCAADVSRTMRFSFEHILVSELGNDDTEEFVLIADQQLELDELIRTDVILSLPTKFLCKPDCLGICPVCGANRNAELCSCAQKTVDPRLEALKQLL